MDVLTIKEQEQREKVIFVDFEKRTDDKRMDRCVESVFKIIKAELPKGEKENKELLRYLLINLVSVYYIHPDLSLGVPFKKDKHPSKASCKQGDYKKTYVSINKLMSLREALRASHLIHYEEGYKAKFAVEVITGIQDKISEIKPTKFLLDLFTHHKLIDSSECNIKIYRANHHNIILKKEDTNGGNIQVALRAGKDYSRKDITKTDKFITSYNNLLSKHTVELELPLEAQEMIDDKVVEGDLYLASRLPDYSRDKYTRIFNRKSYTKNGRYYRHWVQNTPKEWRKYILIDGKETVELDFKGCSINILYAGTTGELCKSDPYENSLGIDRGTSKKILQIILNCGSRVQASKAIKSGCKLPESLSVGKAIDYYIDKHHAIREHLLKDRGLDITYTESLITTAVLSVFIEKGIPIYNIHDSYIVGTQYKELLRETMEEASKEILGVSLQVSLS